MFLHHSSFHLSLLLPFGIHLTITHESSARGSEASSLFMETETKKNKAGFVLQQSKQDLTTMVTKQCIQ